MSYQDIRDSREGFVNMGAGDKLIRIESKILAIITFILMLAYFKSGIISALIVAALIGGVFPWLVGLVKAFAWCAAVVFSLIWAVVGFFIGYLLAGIMGIDTPIIGVLVAIIVFIVSFFLHKVFAGLGYSSVTKLELDAMQSTNANTAQTNADMSKIASKLENSNINN